MFVVQDDKARMVPIKTGRTHEGLIEVVEGSCKPGDTVVVTGNEMLRDQMAVVDQRQRCATEDVTYEAHCLLYSLPGHRHRRHDPGPALRRDLA